MYNPKEVFTEDGYLDHMAHLRNVENAFFWLENNADDLHIGSLSAEQEDMFYQMIGNFNKLLPVLKTGDGETEEGN